MPEWAWVFALAPFALPVYGNYTVRLNHSELEFGYSVDGGQWRRRAVSLAVGNIKEVEVVHVDHRWSVGAFGRSRSTASAYIARSGPAVCVTELAQNGPSTYTCDYVFSCRNAELVASKLATRGARRPKERAAIESAIRRRAGGTSPRV